MTQPQNQGAKPPADSGGGTTTTTDTTNGGGSGGGTSTTGTPGPGSAAWVPRDRLSQVSRENADLKRQLQEIEDDRNAKEEERAKKQGEYQQLADKYKTQAEKEKEKRVEVERAWTRERRLNVWSRAASGVIKAEAIADSFDMLDDDDFKEVDDTDESAMRRLAEQLAERKPYMSDGPRGAGSGGSRMPIATGAGGSDSKLSGRGPILKNRRRRPWK